MSSTEVQQNGDAMAAVAAAATPSGTLFVRGAIAFGIMMISGIVASKFMLEANRAATIEAAKIAELST